MTMKSLRFTLTLLALFTAYSHGAPLVTLSIDSGNRILRDSGGAALLAGGAGTGDGTVVQIGYYTGSIVGNNFGNAGANWTPLTGAGSVFGVTTTIGDTAANGGTAGKIFTDDLNIFTTGGANDLLLPSSGQVLSIRIYNATSLGAATFFNAVSNNTWLWATPANSPNQPLIALFLDDPGLVSQSGAVVIAAGTSVSTTIPTGVPEPTSAALLMIGLVSLASRRRRIATA